MGKTQDKGKEKNKVGRVLESREQKREVTTQLLIPYNVHKLSSVQPPARTPVSLDIQKDPSHNLQFHKSPTVPLLACTFLSWH